MICPNCNKKDIQAYGYRQTIAEKQRIFKCNNCKKRFINKYIKNTKYKPSIIAKAITIYNQGFSLKQTQSLLSKQHKISPPVSTIHDWLNRYKNIFTFTNIRRKQILDSNNIIKTRTFIHEQPYHYKLHLFKSKFINKNLKQYLNNLFTLKITSENLKRCSIESKNYKQKFQTKEKDNITKSFAKFALESITTNNDRHRIVQELMLINDSATIATEVPVFNNQLLGHIDILQQRFNYIYILDYKPDISNQSFSQVLLYKELLASNTNIPKHQIKVACFNENQYIEVE